MSTKTFMAKLARQLNHLVSQRARPLACHYSTLLQPPMKQYVMDSRENKNFISSTSPIHLKDDGTVPQRQIGENVSKKHKIDFLVHTLIDLEDSKDAVYGTLDAWVAWERDFPIGSLKHVLFTLEKEHQWHKVIQVIKWMLSKGQGNTRNTYGQLIQALDVDHRFEEAHEIWKKKLAFDLHSVPWKLCRLMISVYYRNNRLEDLVKLFKGLEAFDRKPPEKSIVQKVADAYEILDMVDEKERLLEKYKDLFDEKTRVKLKKIRSSTRSPNKGK